MTNEDIGKRYKRMTYKQLYRERIEFLIFILIQSTFSVAIWGFRFETFIGVMAGAIIYNFIRMWQE